MRVVYPCQSHNIQSREAVISGHTVNFKDFTREFWDFTGDHLYNFHALPAEFEYQGIVFDTYEVIGNLTTYGIDMPVPELVE